MISYEECVRRVQGMSDAELSRMLNVDIAFDQKTLPVEAYEFFPGIALDLPVVPPVERESPALLEFLSMQSLASIEQRARAKKQAV